MLKKTFFLLVILISRNAVSQQYQPNWQSLDSRPVPQWYRDGKFGIFIHWGVYSVPGWSTKGQYAEWYQQGLQGNDTARQRFHQQKFGDKTYYQLADDFKAELFKPDEWAKLFEKAGAKYIVLTSKHHDGFTLWPNAEANRSWGFKWNAADVGPKRDLLGDLFKAVKKTTVHAGMYYSLYEWFNPLWKKDKNAYAVQHAWPQMKELINNYQPDVFWTDGDWEADEQVWKSKEFLAWLYNESAVKNSVVTYDRWGAGVRFKHGAVFTPEYQPDQDFEDHYFEESRGIGASYGYNREEDAWDYNSTKSLVLQLVDKVSRGGNFLLDIGPDEHGKIPPIMQERLLQIGEWLNINGESIYNTSRWKVSSEKVLKPQKNRPKKGLPLRIVSDEEVKSAPEIFYTYNEKTNSLYVIFPDYPSDHKLRIPGIKLQPRNKITFLSGNLNLSYKQDGDDLVIDLPAYDPAKFPAPYAYSIKIGDYGKFTKKPRINIEYPANSLIPQVSISAVPGAVIHYTTDWSHPTKSSPVYTRPFLLDHSSNVTAVADLPGAAPSTAMETYAEVYQWKQASVRDVKSGLLYFYYEKDSGKINLFLTSLVEKEKTKGIAETISLEKKERQEKFAFRFEGYIQVDRDALYEFFLSSDDGSMMFVDGQWVITNDGDHGEIEKTGRIALRKGLHSVAVTYFDSGGDNTLKLMMKTPGGEKMEVPASMFFH